MENKREREELDFSPIVILFWKKRWLFFIVVLSSLSLTYVVSKMITPEYESFAVIYPSVTTNIEKQLEGLEFGYDVHAERLIQVLETDVIRDSVQKKFDLIKHYNIDLTNKIWEDKFLEKFYSKVDFTKSKYKSVVIQVRDTDPILASEIANYLARIINVVNAQILTVNAREICNVVRGNYEKQLEKVNIIVKQMDDLENSEKSSALTRFVNDIKGKNSSMKEFGDSLDFFRQKFQTADLKSKIESLDQSYELARTRFIEDSVRVGILENSLSRNDTLLISAKAAKEGSLQTVQYFKNRLKEMTSSHKQYSNLEFSYNTSSRQLEQNLLDYENLRLNPNAGFDSRSLERLISEYEWEFAQLNIARNQYQKALRIFSDPGPAAFLVTKAKPSFKKVSPKIDVNVLIALAGYVFATGLIIVLLERFHSFRKSMEE